MRRNPDRAPRRTRRLLVLAGLLGAAGALLFRVAPPGVLHRTDRAPLPAAAPARAVPRTAAGDSVIPTWADVKAETAGAPGGDPGLTGELSPARDLSVPRIPDTTRNIPPKTETPPPAGLSGGEPLAGRGGDDSLSAGTTPGGAASGGEDTSADASTDGPLIPPVILKAAWLSYPREALRRKAEARVEVRILVNESGSVARVELIEEGVDPELARAAVESARSMRFRPATRGGRPVPVWYNYRFDFSLPRSS